jgi:tetratricopeptide (TPR) repeat protein
LPLGKVHRELGKISEAKSIFQQVLTYYENYYGKEHYQTAFVLMNLGQTYIMEGQFEDAENFIKKALDILQKEKHLNSYMCLEALGDLYMKKSITSKNSGEMQLSQNFKNQAINYLRQAQEIVKPHFQPDSMHIMRIQSKIKITEK